MGVQPEPTLYPHPEHPNRDGRTETQTDSSESREITKNRPWNEGSANELNQNEETSLSLECKFGVAVSQSVYNRFSPRPPQPPGRREVREGRGTYFMETVRPSLNAVFLLGFPVQRTELWYILEVGDLRSFHYNYYH